MSKFTVASIFPRRVTIIMSKSENGLVTFNLDPPKIGSLGTNFFDSPCSGVYVLLSPGGGPNFLDGIHILQ